MDVTTRPTDTSGKPVRALASIVVETTFVQNEGPDGVVVDVVLVQGGSVCDGSMRPARIGRGAEARY